MIVIGQLINTYYNEILVGINNNDKQKCYIIAGV